VYDLVERMHSLELRVASDAVQEVEFAAAVAAATSYRQAAAAREALVSGNREEWSVAEVTRGVEEIRMQRLAELRLRRERQHAEAVETHRASKRRTEQMERVVERKRASAAIDDGRRDQAAADDRFASRSAWAQSASGRGKVGG
jgi:hypothetical protein